MKKFLLIAAVTASALFLSCAQIKNVLQRYNIIPRSTIESSEDENNAVNGSQSSAGASDFSWTPIEVGYFDYKSWDMTDGVIKRWLAQHGEETVLKLKALPGSTTIVLEGHADASGPEDYVSRIHPGNDEIGMRRSQAVSNWLVSQGINGNRIEAVSRGENDLKNRTNPRSMENRRVVILVR